MNCQKDQHQLIDYLYQEAGPKNQEEIEAHLTDCPDCSAELAAFQNIRFLTKRLVDPEPSAILSNKIIAYAREEVRETRGRWGLNWIKALATLCIMAVVGGLVAYQFKSGEVAKFSSSSPPETGRSETTVPVTPTTSSDKPREVSKTAFEAKGLPPTPTGGLVKPTETAPSVDADKVTPKTESKKMAGKKKDELPALNHTRALPPEPQAIPAGPPPIPERGVGVSPPKPAMTASAPDKKEKATIAASPSKPEGSPSPSLTDTSVSRPKAPSRRSLETDETPTTTEAKAKPAPTVDLKEGEKALDSGQWERAIIVFEAVLIQLPAEHASRPTILLNLAKAFEAKGDLAKAKTTYQALADESPFHRDWALRKVKELSIR